MGAVRIEYPLTDQHCQGTLALAAVLILTTLQVLLPPGFS